MSCTNGALARLGKSRDDKIFPEDEQDGKSRNCTEDSSPTHPISCKCSTVSGGKTENSHNNAKDKNVPNSLKEKSAQCPLERECREESTDYITAVDVVQGSDVETRIKDVNRVDSLQGESTEAENVPTSPLPAKASPLSQERVSVTPETINSKVEEKPKEVRKLFPLFDKKNWITRKKSSSTDASKHILRSRKRTRMQCAEEDPLEELKIKRKKWITGALETGRDVYFLEAGQKVVGHQTCRVCGMVYTVGLREDEEMHLKFHNSYISGVAFPGWKNERLITEFHDGRLISIFPNDPKNWIKKVIDVCKMVDAELGYADSVPVFREGSKAFLFISSHRRVVGCIITDAISKGYRLLPNSSEEGENGSPWCCSLEPEKAALGINRMWVSVHYRRRSLATRMLEEIRSNHKGGIPKDLIAFSDPSPSGRKFAEKYFGTQTFLVYQWYC